MVAILSQSLRKAERSVSMQIHEGAINRFFQNSAGPVGALIQAKAREIESYAIGAIAPHYRSGDAVQEMKVTGFERDAESIHVRVGTDAAHEWKGHEDFNYPIALELGGYTPSGHYYRYPFLDPAVRAAGFRKMA